MNKRRFTDYMLERILDMNNIERYNYDTKLYEIYDYIKHTFTPSVNEVIQNVLNLFNDTILNGSCVIKHLDCYNGRTLIVNDTFINDYFHRFVDYKRLIDEYHQKLYDYIVTISQEYCKFGNFRCYAYRCGCDCKEMVHCNRNGFGRPFNVYRENDRIYIYFNLPDYSEGIWLNSIDFDRSDNPEL